jgi:L-fuculose-phosphate aldolase
MSNKTEQELREQICLVGRQLHQFRLVVGIGGNISARLDDDRFLITPSGFSKGYMNPDQLIVIDSEGNKVGAGTAANQDLRASSETPMHLEAYKKRPDVGGVLHAHPSHAVALTMAGVDLQRFTIPEGIVLLGIVPTAPYATPSSEENKVVVSDLIERHNAIMLPFHGSLTVGKDPWAAYLLLESLEHNACLIYRASLLGGEESLPQEEIQKLLKMRRDFGFAPPAEYLDE